MITPNYISSDSISRIINLLTIRYWGEFKRREGSLKHGSGIMNLDSKFSTLFVEKGKHNDLIDTIFRSDNQFDSSLKDTFEFIQIQKYSKGDYIVPHRDVYDVCKLHLVTLTKSLVDGLIVEENNTLIKIYDEPGQYVDLSKGCWHWVDPVKNAPRLTLVIGE